MYKFKKSMDGYIFKAPSKRKGKKYDAFDSDDKYITSFGSLPYEHFYDKIGYYKSLNHLDKKRRANYRSRHKKNTGITGLLASYYLW